MAEDQVVDAAEAPDESHSRTGTEGIFDNLWTLPNLFTLIRFFCLPLFLWLLFTKNNPAGAAWLLALLGSTDWVDGWLARRFDQTSEFGKVFDPTVDRILFIVATTAIVIDDRIPLWFALAVLVREVLVGAVIAVATLFFGMERFDVTWWGKTATFLLMGAIPSFLLVSADVWESDFFRIVAYGIGIPGLVLSWYTGIAYIPQIRDGLRAGRADRPSPST